MLTGVQGIVVSDPADIKHVTATRKSSFTRNALIFTPLDDLFGAALIALEGEAWKDQHFVMASIFKKQILRERMDRVFGTHAQTAASLMRARIASGEGHSLDVQTFFRSLTFDTTNSIAFSKGTDALYGGKESVHLQQAFDRLLSTSFERIFFPWWRLNKRFLLTKGERDLATSLSTVDTFLYDIVDTVVNADGTINEDRVHDGTVTTLFVDHLQDLAGGDTALGDVSLRKHLRDLMILMILGARDTTASGLTSVLQFVSQKEHEHWQDKLREEARHAFGDELDRPLLYDDVENAPIAEAVFLEATRLFTPSPQNESVATEEVTFPSGCSVSAGQSVTWSAYALHRNPAIWGPDAEEFRPQRWLGEGRKRYTEYEHHTFGSGARGCLGRPMAMLQVKVTLLTLFSSVRFEMKDSYEPKVEIGLTWGVQDGAFVNMFAVDSDVGDGEEIPSECRKGVAGGGGGVTVEAGEGTSS